MHFKRSLKKPSPFGRLRTLEFAEDVEGFRYKTMNIYFWYNVEDTRPRHWKAKEAKPKTQIRDRRKFVSFFLAVASHVEITVGRSQMKRYPRKKKRAMRSRITSQI